MDNKKTLGLALGAGGSRGVAHIGFLQALEEAGIKPDYISGCSMGSVVGAGYASGMALSDMKKAALSLRFFNLLSLTARPGGLFDTHNIRRILKKYIGDITFDDLQIPFTCIAVDMMTQKVIELSEGSLLDAVVASSSIPAIFKPQEKDGMRLVDGGVLERVPVRRVKKMGADVVVAVDVLGKRSTADKCPNAVVMLMEVIDLMDNYRTENLRKKDKRIIDLWLEPELGNMSQYAFKNLQFAYDQGYKLGLEHVDRIKELLQ